MMTKWYDKLVSSPGDYSAVDEAYEYYLQQYKEGRAELKELVQRGNSVSVAMTMIPGYWGYRYEQLQEMEQIIGFLENREKLLLGIKRRQFREHYNRELNDVMVERYAETDKDVLDLAEIRNKFSLARNKFLALTKQQESLHYQLSNIGNLAKKEVDITNFRFT